MLAEGLSCTELQAASGSEDLVWDYVSGLEYEMHQCCSFLCPQILSQIKSWNDKISKLIALGIV